MLEWVTLETLAMLLAIAYLLLAMRENSLCWYCAFVSTALYVWIFGDVNLYMESALNVYYMAMALYGWYQWQRGGDEGRGVAIGRWSLRQHLATFGAVLIASAISGYSLSAYTDSRLPYLDSLTTWASVATTLMVARKVLENWLYWLVINSVSIYLYIDRELYQTAGLFVLYLVLSVLGYRRWREVYRQQINGRAKPSIERLAGVDADA
ncbi:MAG: nicotinamide riboside transporter PnuC [Cellvibrionales bacterium]|nr:nicotinamide riboside transporter PnuC [Porticoccaceae bacterium]